MCDSQFELHDLKFNVAVKSFWCILWQLLLFFCVLQLWGVSQWKTQHSPEILSGI